MGGGVTPNYFRADGGGVTVVVWPKATNTKPTLDSLFFEIFVKPVATNVYTTDLVNDVSVYPNPCTDILFIITQNL